jgi:hypothetical protein
MLDPFIALDLEINNDIKILACAYYYDKHVYSNNIVFVTNDLALYHFALLMFNESKVNKLTPPDNTYSGYLELTLSDEELADLYQNPKENYYDLLVN